MIFARKIHEFYIIIARKKFFFRILVGTCPLTAIFYAYV